MKKWSDDLRDLNYDFGELAANLATRKNDLFSMADVILILVKAEQTT